MNNHELIEFTKEFMNKTKNYSQFRAGGNLGRIIAGHEIASELKEINQNLVELIKCLKQPKNN